jgi:hypothetical protein
MMATASDGAADVGPTIDLSRRMFDSFFRHLPLYLIPILLFGALGTRTALNVSEDFVSEGTLSASANPLVSTPAIRTTELNDFESPAQGTARLINEQLRTDAFINNVAELAGLTDAIDAEVIDLDVIREQISAVEEGQNFLTVRATWDDSQTSFLLVDSTIKSYLSYVEEIVTGDSADAVEFLTAQLREVEVRVVEAQDELDRYVRQLPPVPDGDTRPTEVQLELSRLSAAVERTTDDVEETDRSIETAELAAAQSQSSAGRQLRVVDEPVRPEQPESGLLKRVITFVTFTLLGTVAAGTVLFVSTWMDRSLRSRRQLAQIVGGASVVVVPMFADE